MLHIHSSQQNKLGLVSFLHSFHTRRKQINKAQGMTLFTQTWKAGAL